MLQTVKWYKWINQLAVSENMPPYDHCFNNNYFLLVNVGEKKGKYVYFQTSGSLVSLTLWPLTFVQWTDFQWRHFSIVVHTSHTAFVHFISFTFSSFIFSWQCKVYLIHCNHKQWNIWQNKSLIIEILLFLLNVYFIVTIIFYNSSNNWHWDIISENFMHYTI